MPLFYLRVYYQLAKLQAVCSALIQSALYHCLAQKFSRLYCQFRQTPDEYSESCKSRNKKVEADTFVIAYHDRCAGVVGGGGGGGACVCVCVFLCATQSLNQTGYC